MESLILEFVYGKGHSMVVKKDEFGHSKDKHGTIKGSLVLGIGNYYIDIYRLGKDKYYSFTLYDL